MIQGPPFKKNVPRGHIDLFDPARHDKSRLPGHSYVTEIQFFGPVRADQGCFPSAQNSEFVNVEFPQIVGHRRGAFVLVPLVEDQASASILAFEVPL
jgi:hypothetical protein